MHAQSFEATSDRPEIAVGNAKLRLNTPLKIGIQLLKLVDTPQPSWDLRSQFAQPVQRNQDVIRQSMHGNAARLKLLQFIPQIFGYAIFKLLSIGSTCRRDYYLTA